jgi:hypothetical protein
MLRVISFLDIDRPATPCPRQAGICPHFGVLPVYAESHAFVQECLPARSVSAKAGTSTCRHGLARVWIRLGGLPSVAPACQSTCTAGRLAKEG